MARLLGFLTVIATMAMTLAAGPSSADVLAVPLHGGLNVREHTSTASSSRVVGRLPFQANVSVWCYRDGSRASYGPQSSQRWFIVSFGDQVSARWVVGFVTVLAFQPPPNDPRVPKCVWNTDWPQSWGPARPTQPPSGVYDPQLWDPANFGPSPDGSQPPAAGGGATGGGSSQPASSGPGAAPVQTWGETVGGVAHTWTNYTNAGGSEGPSIPAYATVQIACKVTGFRVADGNTWWYRIAQAPWSNSYYVSADAFYNNGQSSGSLHGTPFYDPDVASC